MLSESRKLPNNIHCMIQFTLNYCLGTQTYVVKRLKKLGKIDTKFRITLPLRRSGENGMRKKYPIHRNYCIINSLNFM